MPQQHQPGREVEQGEHQEEQPHRRISGAGQGLGDELGEVAPQEQLGRDELVAVHAQAVARIAQVTLGGLRLHQEELAVAHHAPAQAFVADVSQLEPPGIARCLTG